MVEKISLVASEFRSVTAFILSFTFLTAAVVSADSEFKVALSSPLRSAAFVVTSDFMRSKSAVAVKSIILSAAEAFASFALTAFAFTTSTTELSAVLKASAASAPAPSVAEANEEMAVVICLLIFATSKACATAVASFSSTLNGLKFSGSIPSGRPNTSATSAAVRLPSCINVDVGEITPEPEGAFKVIPANVAPEDESTVWSSAMATKS